jgi:8-oxo-dGTP diphosphatase
MRDVTLCLPIQGNPTTAVLLGQKKIGFGQGKVTGFGGKVNAGEMIINAAIRELHEEIGLTVMPDALHPIGILSFQFPARPDWQQRAHVFLVEAWLGEPTETMEMKPAWFAPHALPLVHMWADAHYWLPRVLARQWIDATFTFGPDNATLIQQDVWGDTERRRFLADGLCNA